MTGTRVTAIAAITSTDSHTRWRCGTTRNPWSTPRAGGRKSTAHNQEKRTKSLAESTGIGGYLRQMSRHHHFFLLRERAFSTASVISSCALSTFWVISSPRWSIISTIGSCSTVNCSIWVKRSASSMMVFSMRWISLCRACTSRSAERASPRRLPERS